MPLYEYGCGKCGQVFEHLAMNRADVPEKCPACGAKGPKKQMAAFQARSKASAEPSCLSSGACRPGLGCQGGVCPHAG